MEQIALPANKWVGDNVIEATFGLSEDNLKNYRSKIWEQGKHFRKIGTSGQASAGKAKIVYNLPEINRWIETYPQHH
ncbi:excisionase family protein [Vibrio sp. SCSIO 43136]|uniref:excisionase family protein n=1 Tax=Vibrio sp. SCSIO 43136 TaxID=2819101 RepID=UPI0020761E96|nr:excisionase family protein [Vibrio sp. SCSIO 43136]USD64244.1 excisionase family protein [Vibrio sp. SCSIO 43136]